MIQHTTSGASVAHEGKAKVVGAWMAVPKQVISGGRGILDTRATHHMSSMPELYVIFK